MYCHISFLFDHLYVEIFLVTLFSGRSWCCSVWSVGSKRVITPPFRPRLWKRLVHLWPNLTFFFLTLSTWYKIISIVQFQEILWGYLPYRSWKCLRLALVLVLGAAIHSRSEISCSLSAFLCFSQLWHRMGASSYLVSILW